jgi:hypothetical protein
MENEPAQWPNARSGIQLKLRWQLGVFMFFSRDKAIVPDGKNRQLYWGDVQFTKKVHEKCHSEGKAPHEHVAVWPP